MAKPRNLPSADVIRRLFNDKGCLAVHVTPNASATTILLPADGTTGVLQMRVTETPEGGKANAAVITLLAKALRVPKSDLMIVSGHAARNKVIEIRA
jgi:uncharacterized protein